jgi:hypothetical protein
MPQAIRQSEAKYGLAPQIPVQVPSVMVLPEKLRQSEAKYGLAPVIPSAPTTPAYGPTITR